ncbi:dihydrofolate reductase family protein [Streptococcus suis]|nr:dihydrofolate reductase family protein [Streptococcus suis]MBM7270293.1 dihydrofolate reductase family protein [Streptococcus suis]
MEEIRRVKEAEGGDIVVLGSPRLAQTLLKAGLVN